MCSWVKNSVCMWLIWCALQSRDEIRRVGQVPRSKWGIRKGGFLLVWETKLMTWEWKGILFWRENYSNQKGVISMFLSCFITKTLVQKKTQDWFWHQRVVSCLVTKYRIWVPVSSEDYIRGWLLNLAQSVQEPGLGLTFIFLCSPL